MNIKTILLLTSTIIFIVSSVGLFIGCETDSTETKLVVVPQYTELGKDESQVFTVSGGYNYQWSLEDPCSGSLSSEYGSTVTYTAIGDCWTECQCQKIYITSYIEGGSASTATNAGYYQSTTAYVLHRSANTNCDCDCGSSSTNESNGFF
jgi:hypothetical protein